MAGYPQWVNYDADNSIILQTVKEYSERIYNAISRRVGTIHNETVDFENYDGFYESPILPSGEQYAKSGGGNVIITATSWKVTATDHPSNAEAGSVELINIPNVNYCKIDRVSRGDISTYPTNIGFVSNKTDVLPTGTREGNASRSLKKIDISAIKGTSKYLKITADAIDEQSPTGNALLEVFGIYFQKSTIDYHDNKISMMGYGNSVTTTIFTRSTNGLAWDMVLLIGTGLESGVSIEAYDSANNLLATGTGQVLNLQSVSPEITQVKVKITEANDRQSRIITGIGVYWLE